MTHPVTTPPAYERDTYTLVRYELVAPSVRNDGAPSGYPERLGVALDDAGYGWTSVPSKGCWQGRIEPGETFTVYAEPGEDGALAAIARSVMTDQDAIQLVVFPSTVTLIEA